MLSEMYMYDGIGLEEVFHLRSETPPIKVPEVLSICESEMFSIVASEIVQLDTPGTEVLDGVPQAVVSVSHSVGIDVSDDMVESLNEFKDMIPGLSLANLRDFFTWLGVETYLIGNGEFDQVLWCLSNGFPVILSGDIGEILETDDLSEDDIVGEHADTAFVIKSLDISDPENPMVTLYALDGSGADGVTIPLSQLEDAWADSGYDYLIFRSEHFSQLQEIQPRQLSNSRYIR